MWSIGGSFCQQKYAGISLGLLSFFGKSPFLMGKTMLILLYPLVMSKVSYGKIHHFYSWEKPLFLWPFSMATLVYQRVIYLRESSLICFGWTSCDDAFYLSRWWMTGWDQ
jgi:hypothetical protein